MSRIRSYSHSVASCVHSRGEMMLCKKTSLHLKLTQCCKSTIVQLKRERQVSFSESNPCNIFFFSIYFWMHWVFIAVRGLFSSCGEWELLCCGARASHCGGFSCCGARALGSWASVVAGLAAAQHLGSSRTRARTRVPCIGRQILNHCATREAPVCVLYQGL